MTLKRILAVGAAVGTALALTGVAIAQSTEAPAAAPAATTEAAAVTPTDEAPAAGAAELPADGPAGPGDATAGEAKATACAACHGADGNAADPQYPNLAGQHEHYIARQLALYKSGERDNAIMLGFAATRSSQDMRDIGAYFAKQVARPGVADESLIAEGPNAGRKFYEIGQKLYRSGDPARGIPACAACHGPTGAGVPGPSWPALHAQHAQYTAVQLRAFRDGTVWGKDANANGIMAAVARNLTDEEIDSLSSFLQGLHDVRDAAPADATASR
ncbi:MAG: c-type cytochrome [Silanimonas sp.]